MSVDVNKDGVLTRTEVTAWLKTKKEESLTEEVQLQWVQYDANNDGTISWVEFKEATFSSESTSEIPKLSKCTVSPLQSGHLGIRRS